MLGPNIDLALQLFHVQVSSSWAVVIQSLQDSGSEEGSSNSLMGLNWSPCESVKISCTSCCGGRGETNHNGSLTVGHMKLGLGGGCISWSDGAVGCVNWSGVAVGCVNPSPIWSAAVTMALMSPWLALILVCANSTLAGTWWSGVINWAGFNSMQDLGLDNGDSGDVAWCSVEGFGLGDSWSLQHSVVPWRPYTRAELHV